MLVLTKRIRNSLLCVLFAFCVFLLSYSIKILMVLFPGALPQTRLSTHYRFCILYLIFRHTLHWHLTFILVSIKCYIFLPLSYLVLLCLVEHNDWNIIFTDVIIWRYFLSCIRYCISCMWKSFNILKFMWMGLLAVIGIVFSFCLSIHLTGIWSIGDKQALRLLLFI